MANADQVDVYEVANFTGLDIKLKLQEAYGWVIPVGEVNEFTTHSGRKGQSMVVLANGPGVNSLRKIFDHAGRKHSNVKLVKIYIPARERNDNLRSLYVSMAVLTPTFLKFKEKFGDNFKQKCTEKVSELLRKKLEIMTAQDLLDPSSFNVDVYIDDECKAFGFLNFKKVTPWQLALVKVVLKQYYWDFLSNDDGEYHYIDARFNKMKPKPAKLSDENLTAI
jgi:hypothetical protein